MQSSIPNLAGVGALLAACAFTTTSSAQDQPPPPVVVVPQQQTTPPPAPPPNTTVQPLPSDTGSRTSVTHGPNMKLVGTGALVFAATYIPSVIVAGTSNHQGDSHLYVPIAGPWLDMADRGSCPATSSSCDSETTTKVFLALDGVFQAVGVVAIVAGLLSTSDEEIKTTTRTAAKAEPPKPRVYVSPARVGRDAYGVFATGTF